MSEHFSDQELESIMSKIEGLMAMTEENGCTASEAAAAADAIERILTKYNLDRAQLKFTKKDGCKPDMKQSSQAHGGNKRFRNKDWVRDISFAVGRLYYCRVWWYSNGVVMFFGEAHDVAIAETMLTHLVDQAQRRCKYVWANRAEHNVAHLSYLPYETAFYSGFGAEMYSKLMGLVRERNKVEQVAGLVVSKDAQIEDFIKDLYPHLYQKLEEKKPTRPLKPKKERRLQGPDPLAFMAGVQQAKETDTHKRKEL